MNNKVMSEATRQRYETMWGQKEELRFLANLGTFRAESPSRVEEVPPHVRRDLLRGYMTQSTTIEGAGFTVRSQ